MADYAIRKCGGGWMYCTGECKKCIDSRILATGGTSGDHTKTWLLARCIPAKSRNAEYGMFHMWSKTHCCTM